MCAQRHGFGYRIGDFMITAITYGDERLLVTEPIERAPNDTSPWR